MARNVYDRASRYAAKLDSLGFIIWLLNTPAIIFHRWVDTRRLRFPKEPDDSTMEAEGKAEMLLEVLELKFGPVPADLDSAIRPTTDLAKLKQWVAAAVSAASLADSLPSLAWSSSWHPCFYGTPLTTAHRTRRSSTTIFW